MMTADSTSRPASLDGFSADQRRNEIRTRIVATVCGLTLVAQIAGGAVFHSMALTASGFHMAAHLAAMLIAAGAYAFARRHAASPRFAFGAGKVGVLAGFANAMVLGVTAVLIAAESVERLFEPQAVDYASAVPLAIAGLAITLVCVWLLKPTEDGRHDLNLSAAHLHLSADAWVGMLSILGLIAGRRLGWAWADPAAGLVGAALVGQFALSLLGRAAAVLLDMTPPPEMEQTIRERLEAEGERVVDLRLWRLEPGRYAVAAVVCSRRPQSPQAYRTRLTGLAPLGHVTIEVRAAASPPQSE